MKLNKTEILITINNSLLSQAMIATVGANLPRMRAALAAAKKAAPETRAQILNKRLPNWKMMDPASRTTTKRTNLIKNEHINGLNYNYKVYDSLLVY